MIVSSINDITGTNRDVHGQGFQSLRLLLASDGLGFSVHKTVIPKGGPYTWHYKRHLEACYCIAGRGILSTETEQWQIEPDTLYALNEHDRHTFEALTDVVLISIFNPPVTGREIHQEDGSYELANS